MASPKLGEKKIYENLIVAMSLLKEENKKKKFNNCGNGIAENWRKKIK